MVIVFSVVGGLVVVMVGVMIGLVEGIFILVFVILRCYWCGDEVDFLVCSWWWVFVWMVFGCLLGVGFFVFVVFFVLVFISGGGGIGMGDVKWVVFIGFMG